MTGTKGKELNEFLNEGRESRVRNHGIVPGPAVVCNDGYTVSVQCGEFSYCSPRTTLLDVSEYDSFELGYPNKHDDIIEKYAEAENDQVSTVFPYVPRRVVLELIKSHGGIASTKD